MEKIQTINKTKKLKNKKPRKCVKCSWYAGDIGGECKKCWKEEKR